MKSLRVNPIACEAYGYCAEIIPERIVRDDWGFPMVSRKPVSPELMKAAEKAVSTCPRRALLLEAEAAEVRSGG